MEEKACCYCQGAPNQVAAECRQKEADSTAANLVQMCSYSLESTKQCDVSDSHPGEVSVQTVTVIRHIKQKR